MEYPVKTPQQLAHILRGIRKDRRLTQAAVAEQMGSLQSKVSTFEANPAKNSIDRLFRLLSVLGLELVIRDRQQPNKKREW